MLPTAAVLYDRLDGALLINIRHSSSEKHAIFGVKISIDSLGAALHPSNVFSPRI